MVRKTTLAVAVLSAMMFAGVLSAVEVGEDAPDFEFKKTWNFSDDINNLKDLNGKVAMIEVWATW